MPSLCLAVLVNAVTQHLFHRRVILPSHFQTYSVTTTHQPVLVSFKHSEVLPKPKFLLNTKLKALSGMCVGWWLSSSLLVSIAQPHAAFRYMAVMDVEVKDSGDWSYWEFHGYFCRQNLGECVYIHDRLVQRIGMWVIVIDRWSSFTSSVNESALK